VTAHLEQAGYDVCLEWGEAGVRMLAPSCDTLVIVDVLSFTTAVDVAVSRGASVVPFAHFDARADDFARREGAVLAVRRGQMSGASPYSLSPPSLLGMAAGMRLVLPSPNGSTLTVAASSAACTVIAGCLRNAHAVAAAARSRHGRIGVIAAGERWADGSLRPAIEDLIGAGAIINDLGPATRSPEAELAASAFEHARNDLDRYLKECASGRELIELGFVQDVECAADLDVSWSVPTLVAGAYQDAAPPAPRATEPGPEPNAGR
jgi:2-phosphosulfolactate phosphatase